MSLPEKNLPIHYSPGTVSLPGVQLRSLSAVKGRVSAAHPVPEQVQLILTDDAFIRQLNAAYRGKDMATDVLSFDLGADSPLDEDSTYGEIYISLERARTQAAEQGVTLLEELTRLLIHGLLHLAGYDHDTPEKLHYMENETDRFLPETDLSSSSPPFNRSSDNCSENPRTCCISLDGLRTC